MRTGIAHHTGLEFQVAAQKLIVYTSILNLALPAFAIRR
jgi:hypothetical protein